MSFRSSDAPSAAALLLLALAGSSFGADEAPLPPPRCTVRGEVLRAFAPTAATVEIRRVAMGESTQADEEWYVRAATQRALFATLADGPPLVTVKADGTGAFEAADLPLGVLEIRATAADGATCCVAARALARGETVQVTADLPGGSLTITGRAVRRDGTPFRGLVAIDARDFELLKYGGSKVTSWPGAVETGPDGKFTLRGVTESLHRIVAIAPGSFASRSARFFGAAAPEFVIDAEGAQSVRPEAAPPALVSGRITAGGKPVAGARVVAVPTESSPRDIERLTRTGADGRYELPIDERGSWAVFVLDDEWISPEAATQDPYADWNPLAVWVEAGDRLTADRTAVACARVRGTVVDAAHKPVANARVESWPQDGSLWSGVCDRLPLATSAADGTFIVPTLPGRSVTVCARLGKCMSDQPAVGALAPGGIGVAMPTFRPLSFAGVMVQADDGSPIGGAILYLHSESGCLGWVYGEVRTRADGRVRIGPLDVREITASTSADGFVPADAEVKFGSETPAVITLQRGRRITGRIALPKGVRGELWIKVVRPAPAGGGEDAEIETVRAADDGTFVTPALARGRYRVEAAFTAADGRSWIGSAAGTTEEFPPVIDLLHSGESLRRFAIGVADAEGRPVSRGTVIASWQEPGWRASAAGSVESGVASVGLPPHARNVWVLVDPLTSGLASTIAGPFDPSTDTPKIRIDPALRICGVAHRDDGTPVPGLTVSAFALSDPTGVGFAGPRATTRTAADGRFELRGLGAGSWRLVSEPPGGSTANAPVAEAGASGVEIVVGAGISAIVRVLDWDGVPVQGATVVVRRFGSENVNTVAAENTGAEGALRVARLAAGTPHSLHVQPPRTRGDLREWDDAAWMPKDTEIRLVREYVLTGVVVDAAGHGVDGVVVWARTNGDVWRSADTRGGAFTLPHLGSADAEVVVVRSGEPGDRAPEKVTIGDAPARLVYEPGPSISVTLGRTVEETMQNAGMDLPYRATLVLGDAPDGPLVATQMVREGRTSVFDHLKKGERYSLFFNCDPTVRTWGLNSMCAFRKGLEPGDSVSVTPAPGPVIEGRLTSPGRTLPAKIRVTATLGALRCAAEVTGDHYVVRGLVDGLWKIEADATSDGRDIGARADVEAGETADLELRAR